MPARVTTEQVKSVIDTKLTDLTAFIDTAELTINEELLDKGLSEEKLNMIALYLSAHFVTLRERQVKSIEFGDAENVYQSNARIGFKASTYGQQALILDTSKTLRKLGRGQARIVSI